MSCVARLLAWKQFKLEAVGMISEVYKNGYRFSVLLVLRNGIFNADSLFYLEITFMNIILIYTSALIV